MTGWKQWRRRRRQIRSIETLEMLVLADIADQGSFYTLSLVDTDGEWFWLNLRKSAEIESLLAEKRRT